MSKVLYIVTDVFLQHNDLYSRIIKITLPRIYKYAKKYNIDVIELTDKDYNNFVYDTRIIDRKSKIYHMLYYAFDCFLKSSYDQFLFLDIDVLIQENSPNIFNLLQDKNSMHIKFYDLPNGSFDKDCSYDQQLYFYTMKQFYKKFLDLITHGFYCTGVVLSDRFSIEKIYSVPDGNWNAHTDRLANICHNQIKTSSINYAFQDEDNINNYILNYFLRDSKYLKQVKFNPLTLLCNDQYINNMDHYQLTTIQSLYNKERPDRLYFTPLNTDLWNVFINNESKLSKLGYFSHFAGTTGKKLLLDNF